MFHNLHSTVVPEDLRKWAGTFCVLLPHGRDESTQNSPSPLPVQHPATDLQFYSPALVSKIARTTGAEDKSRTFSPWSHVVSLGYAQLTHSIGLNDVCDSLQLHSGPLTDIRGATAPSRNGLSNANRERPAEMAEQLFWQVMNHLGEQSPGFVAGRSRGPAFRFKLPIHVVDTTV